MTNWMVMMMLYAILANTGFAPRCVRLNSLLFAEARKYQAKFAPLVYVSCSILKSAQSFIYSKNMSNNGDEV